MLNMLKKFNISDLWQGATQWKTLGLNKLLSWERQLSLRQKRVRSCTLDEIQWFVGFKIIACQVLLLLWLFTSESDSALFILPNCAPVVTCLRLSTAVWQRRGCRFESASYKFCVFFMAVKRMKPRHVLWSALSKLPACSQVLQVLLVVQSEIPTTQLQLDDVQTKWSVITVFACVYSCSSIMNS